MDFLSRFLSRFTGKAVGTRGSTAGVLQFFLNRAFPDLRTLKIAEGYTAWAFACINAIAGDVSMMALQLQQQNQDREWEEVDGGDPMTLLKRPNRVMTGSDLVFSTEAWLQVDGNAFWFVGYNGTKPNLLWPLDPERVTVIKDEQQIVKGYRFLNPAGQNRDLAFEEVIHFKKFNPKDPYRGMGTIEAASVAIETDVNASKWNRQFFQNSAIPDAVLQTDQKLTDDVFKRLKATWDHEFRGLNNAHKTAILEAGLKLAPTSLNHKDMQFLELKGYGRDEICALFKVPQLVLGRMEGSNRASAGEVDEIFAKRTIKPEINFIVERLNAFYLPLWGITDDTKQIGYDDPVPENEDLTLKKKESGIKNYYWTINEVRAMDGMKPLPGGDTLYVPSTVVPIELAGKLQEQLAQGGGQNNQGGNQDQGKKSLSKVERRKQAELREFRREFADLYKRMAEHLSQKLTNHKTANSYQVKSKVLARLIKESGSEDEIPADPSIAEHALEDFSLIFEPAAAEKLSELVPPLYEFAGKEMVARASIDLTFNLKNPRAVKWLKAHVLERATQIPDTVKEQIGRVIEQGVADGRSVQGIADDVAKFFTDQKDWRVMRIARTEVITAYEQGSLEGARQAGIFTEKGWIIRGPGCPICVDNAKEGMIPIREAFASGDTAPTAHPHCECGLIYQ